MCIFLWTLCGFEGIFWFAIPSNVHCLIPRCRATHTPRTMSYLRRDVGGRGTPRSFVEQRQDSLDRRYGKDKLVASWHMKRIKSKASIKEVFNILHPLYAALCMFFWSFHYRLICLDEVLLQRERPPPAPSFSLWPKGEFDPANVTSAEKEGFCISEGQNWIISA